ATLRPAGTGRIDGPAPAAVRSSVVSRAQEDARMALTFRKLHPRFVGEAGPIELRRVHDEATLDEIRAGMAEYAVLVVREQPFTHAEQIAFAERLDGQLHSKTGSSALYPSRFGNEALSDISNVGADGEILRSDDRRRMYGLGNRL